MQRLRASVVMTLASLVLALLACGQVQAADAPKDEYAIKAALVYNFARFTEWPPESFTTDHMAFRIAVYGSDDLAKAFAEIKGKVIAGHVIEIVHAVDPEDVADCQLLFLARTERDQWPRVLSALAGEAVLTIGEMNGFLEAGGMMNLHTVGRKIRFEVNLDHVQTKNLSISSRILKLATEVVDTAEGNK